MKQQQKALLALENGELFYGSAIGALGRTCGEVVFNTAMTGYQEILTDPSYASQMIALTYPHIGNVGVNSEDAEADKIWAAALIIRDLSLVASNWRSQMSLQDYLQKHNIIGIADIDTRQLTRILRDQGALRGCIIAGDEQCEDAEAAVQAAQKFSGLKGKDLAKEVSTKKSYSFSETSHLLLQTDEVEKVATSFHVVAYDFGVKKHILQMLVDRGARVTVVNAKTTADEALALAPDGIFLSNGPGDPEPCDYAIAAVKVFLEKKIPLFGICLGHQILALAAGAKTIKMKFGHHGANHPVQDLATKQVLITSQNHSFAVDEASLPATLQPSYRSLFDGTLQGIAHTQSPAYGFQGHPEASPGPHDVANVFDKFIQMIADNDGNLAGASEICLSAPSKNLAV